MGGMSVDGAIRLRHRAGGMKGVLSGGFIREGVCKTPREIRAQSAEDGAVTCETVCPCSLLHLLFSPTV